MCIRDRNITVEDPDSALFKGLPTKQYVWMSHGDLVTQAPEGFEVTASSKNCPIAAIANPDKKFYGIQFHAEEMCIRDRSSFVPEYLGRHKHRMECLGSVNFRPT